MIIKLLDIGIEVTFLTLTYLPKTQSKIHF